MAIKSLFILDSTGDVLIEKHWRGVTTRAVCELFWEEVRKVKRREDLAPVITTPKYYLIHVLEGPLTFLVAVTSEVAPLMVVEFLNNIISVFRLYFDEKLTENTIQENFATVYQLLEEMMDSGFPLITEPNTLVSLVAPPSVASRVVNFVTGKSGVSETISSGAMSIIRWRRDDVSYTQNEIYFDLVEAIDAIVEANGTVAHTQVSGTLTCTCHLSGMPDLVLSFTDPSALEDVAFHPSVRYSRFERERVLSFVPPDGLFELMSYRVKTRHLNCPIYCRPMITYGGSGTGRVEVTVGQKPFKGISLGGPQSPAAGGGAAGAAGAETRIEEVAVVLTFPKEVKAVDLSVNTGGVVYDVTDIVVARWVIGRMPADKTPSLSGTAHLHAGVTRPETNLTANLQFSVGGVSISGLRIANLNMTGETYPFYKGMRSMIKGGNFHIRT